MAIAMHHLHLHTIPSLPSQSGRQVHWATTEAGLSIVCGNITLQQPKWYGTVWYGLT